jgi:hypothetical protein
MKGAKYREILDENLLQTAQDLRLGQRFTFQQDNDPTYTAKPMQGFSMHRTNRDKHLSGKRKGRGI